MHTTQSRSHNTTLPSVTRRQLLCSAGVGAVGLAMPQLGQAKISDLQSQLNWLVKRQRREGRVSSAERTAWVVYDFQTRQTLVSINANRSMQAASMVKVFVALAYFYLNKQAPHKYPYDARIRRLMEQMLVRSSNTATNAIMRLCKGPHNVKRLCQLATKNGFKQLRIVEYIPAGGRTYRNRISANDYNRFLMRLWANQLPHSPELKRIMGISNTDRITTDIMSPTVRVLDKTGSTSMLCGDMGIVRLGQSNQAYTFIGIIERSHRTTQYGRWIKSRADAMREVSELVYRCMTKRYQILNSMG